MAKNKPSMRYEDVKPAFETIFKQYEGTAHESLLKKAMELLESLDNHLDIVPDDKSCHVGGMLFASLAAGLLASMASGPFSKATVGPMIYDHARTILETIKISRSLEAVIKELAAEIPYDEEKKKEAQTEETKHSEETSPICPDCGQDHEELTPLLAIFKSTLRGRFGGDSGGGT